VSPDETLAVALILGDAERLGALKRGGEPAPERLRHDLGLPKTHRSVCWMVWSEDVGWCWSRVMVSGRG
jgi:hypothetical protein